MGRDFEALIQRVGGAKAIGSACQALHDELFAISGTHKSDRIRWETMQRRMIGIEARFGAVLERGVRCRDPAARSLCKLSSIEPSLFVFARVRGVEPTNNGCYAARGIRPAAQWRKICFGTQTSKGNCGSATAPWPEPRAPRGAGRAGGGTPLGRGCGARVAARGVPRVGGPAFDMSSQASTGGRQSIGLLADVQTRFRMPRPGCENHLARPLAVGADTTDRQGVFRLSLTVPNVPALIGSRLFLQAVIPRTGGPRFGALEATDALEL